MYMNRMLLFAIIVGSSATFIPDVGLNCTDPDDLQEAETSECGDVLICEAGHCRACISDAECIALNGPEQACIRFDKKGDKVCTHKYLLPPDTRDYISVLLAIVLCAIAAGGGIGGGGLLLPMLILLLSFTPHEASPLANATVLGGAAASLALNAGKRHPSGRKPLISYEVALMMEPMTVAGALAGVLLNRIFPGWLITVLLVAVLGITTQRTLKKGLEGWRKESAAASIAAAQPDASASLLSPAQEGSKVAGRGGTIAHVGMTSDDHEYAALLAAEASEPAFDVAALVISLVLVTAVSVLKGPNRERSPLHVRCGSREYWALLFLQLLLLLGVSLGIRRTLLKRHERRKACKRWDFLPDDVVWTPSSSIQYPLLCAVAGLCAGLFGIGGGIVKGPLMLEMGMQPTVASATSSFMIFFTALSATLQFAMLGDIRLGYAGVLFVAGLVGTAVGQYVVGAMLKRSGRQSLIVLLIAFIIGGSTLVMTVLGTFDFLAELREGKSQGFRPLCGSSLVED
jgi:uncharacterized membrane protein YfcA